MKAKPILFSAPMIRAIQREIESPGSGKTQTRRVVKPQPDSSSREAQHYSDDDQTWIWINGYDGSINGKVGNGICPYGGKGDVLWARETCRAHELSDKEAESGEWVEYDELPHYGTDGVLYLADKHFKVIENSREASDAWIDLYHYGKKQGATVPGIHMPKWASRYTLLIEDVRVERLNKIRTEDAIAEGVELRHDLDHPIVAFRALWDSINGKTYPWDSNPWVWVIKFKPTPTNILDYLKTTSCGTGG